MTKARWEKTPFETLEGARATAEGMSLHPGKIITQGKMRFFQFSEGRTLHTLAQAVAGGPVKEKEEKKGKRYRDPSPKVLHREWVVGPWIRTDHGSLEEAEAGHLGEFINPENVEVVRVIMFRDQDCETEYAKDARGVWTRVMTKSPLRDAGYRKAVETSENKAREDGTLK